MESQIAKAIHPQYQPVAMIWSDEKPAGAMQFQEKKWGCVMWLVANAAKGKIAVADSRTFGCFGGGVGLGFGNQYKSFPGGEEGFCHFLSSGTDGWVEGPAVAEKIKPFMRAEAYDKDGSLRKRFSITSLKRIGDVWIPRAMDFSSLPAGQALPSQERSRLEIDDGNYETQLPAEQFAPALFGSPGTAP